MKIISRVFILFLSVFTLCVIVGCTTPSDSSDNNYSDPGLAASTKKAWYKKIKSVTINQYRKSDAVGPDEKPVKSYTASSDYWLTGVDSKSYFSPAIVYDDEHYDYTYSVTTWNIAGGWGSFWCIQ